MALPLSRNRDYGSGTPVASADLDDLQDMIIAGKYGAIDIPIDGAAFTVRGPNFAATMPAFGDHWTFVGCTPPNDTLVASLRLPVGVKINTVKWHINKNSQASGMVLTVRKRNESGGVYTNSNVDTVTAATNGASYIIVTRSPGYRIVAGDALHLIVSIGHANHQFSHAVLNVQKDA
ncbi:MAG TPA: hypothetical protein VN253_03015 [Kofleriaceae bacterium]|nr:hypothetical protein [Kofleriaceae bacterium]